MGTETEKREAQYTRGPCQPPAKAVYFPVALYRTMDSPSRMRCLLRPNAKDDVVSVGEDTWSALKYEPDRTTLALRQPPPRRPFLAGCEKPDYHPAAACHTNS